jgi:ribosomal protein L17
LIEVRALIEEHKKIKGLVEQVKKTNIGKNDKPQNLMRNQNQMMNKLQQMIKPQMMAQLGGAPNIMKYHKRNEYRFTIRKFDES